ncbi:hypothetical protein [Lutibacter sp.]
MKKNKNIIIIIIALIIIDIALIANSGADKGKAAFYSIPLILLINSTISIYGFIKKNKKIGIAALILFFLTPIFAFIVFVYHFPFLTR